MMDIEDYLKPGYLILGAYGGIGAEICRLLRPRAALLLAGRNQAKLEELGRELNSPWRVVDATSFNDMSECFQAAADQLGQLDGTVNCVGSVILKPAHLTTEMEWADTVAKNLTSAFATVHAAGKVLRQGGNVVLISTAAAHTGLPNHDAISAAKAGVEGLVRSAAATYASRKIRFNAIAPGLVRTPLTERIWSHEKSAEASRNLHAVGRLGEPRDIAAMAQWLLEPDNDWITGQVFTVDGGLSTVRSVGRL
jgi:NAD(P)-dependent dehydrogenase (short-subunit alcohol dehydrogenase family)